jgi:mRNA-degrading endonuclease RelE of RelBE toxin-antitoxin system
MKVEIRLTDDFNRAAKKLLKKYHSLNTELQTLSGELKENPRMGVLIAENTYKIRLAVKVKAAEKVAECV